MKAFRCSAHIGWNKAFLRRWNGEEGEVSDFLAPKTVCMGLIGMKSERSGPPMTPKWAANEVLWKGIRNRMARAAEN